MSEQNIIPILKDQCEISQTSMTYNAFDIYLDEEIKDPTYYRQVFQVLRSAQRGDLVRIYISSPGGNLNSAVMFRNNIRNCEADVVAVIEAEAYSAASLIALSCPSIEVKPYATMMCHSAAFGSGGIVQNVRDHVEFTGKHAEAFMEEVYRDFLDATELEDLRRGREIWLSYEEIAERLDKMFDARDNESCDCGNCDGDESQGFNLEEMIGKIVEEKLKSLDVAPKEKVKSPRQTKPKQNVVKEEQLVAMPSE